eukprot:m.127388 g.127388  ORF g.127388 m.127388 type:complete len:633 (-) comp13008_c0_seq1:173-2071(-)
MMSLQPLMSSKHLVEPVEVQTNSFLLMATTSLCVCVCFKGGKPFFLKKLQQNNKMTDIVSKEKLEAITNEVKDEMKTFTKDFLSSYKSALVSEALSVDGGDAEGGEGEGEESGEPERELLCRDGGSESDEPLMVGTFMKRGDVRKNWKERCFVVRADYLVEYYENEDKFKAGAKPKGVINLAGYQVVVDPNGRKIKEKQKEVEVYGTSFSGEYTKYEPLTLECYSETKRRWLFRFKDVEEFNTWSDIFSRCVKKVRSGTLDDEQMQAAYHDAITAMAHRYWCDPPQGKEIDAITEMIGLRAWNIHIGGDGAFKDIGGPPAVKRTARNKGFQLVFKTVEVAVTAAWTVLIKTVSAVSEKTKELVAQGIGPIRTARSTIIEKIQGAITDTTTPVQENVLVPVAGALVSILSKACPSPILSAEDVLDSATLTYAEDRAQGNDASLKNIKKSSAMMKPLNSAFADLGASFDGEAMDGVLSEITSRVPAIGDAVDTLKGLLNLGDLVDELRESATDNTEHAGYTFEKLLEDELAGDSSQAIAKRDMVLQSVKEKYRHDMRICISDAFKNFLNALLFSLLFDKVGEACETLCNPFDQLVPEALSDLLSINGILTEALEGFVEGVVDSAVEEGLKSLEI